MSLLQQINTAAKTFVPPEKPLVEMLPMIKLIAKKQKGDKKKADTYKAEQKQEMKKHKTLRDFLAADT